MRYFKLTIAYDGTDFHGWQIQANKPTVQGEIVNVLRRITQENVQLHAAGRTDAGVHALGQVGSFRTQSARTSTPAGPHAAKSTGIACIAGKSFPQCSGATCCTIHFRWTKTPCAMRPHASSACTTSPRSLLRRVRKKTTRSAPPSARFIRQSWCVRQMAKSWSSPSAAAPSCATWCEKWLVIYLT